MQVSAEGLSRRLAARTSEDTVAGYCRLFDREVRPI